MTYEEPNTPLSHKEIRDLLFTALHELRSINKNLEALVRNSQSSIIDSLKPPYNIT